MSGAGQRVCGPSAPGKAEERAEEKIDGCEEGGAGGDVKPLTVVVRRTSCTPKDAWVGPPDLFSPRKGLVKISCVFTWDRAKAENLRDAWEDWGCGVDIGGPAFDDPGGEFTPGQFVRHGITFTSRGCPRECPWCYVPKREGKLRELKTIHPGKIINDNNFLACSRSHQRKVLDMLKGQTRIEFKGGLDPRLLTTSFIEELRGLRLKELYLSADHEDYERHTLKAIAKLKDAGFSPRKIRCYVMIGRNETMERAEERLRRVFKQGAWPYAQVWDGLSANLDSPKWSEEFRKWKRFARVWERPALMKAHMKEVACSGS
jgi:hypothetical protein